MPTFLALCTRNHLAFGEDLKIRTFICIMSSLLAFKTCHFPLGGSGAARTVGSNMPRLTALETYIVFVERRIRFTLKIYCYLVATLRVGSP